MNGIGGREIAAKKHGPLALIHFDAPCDTWADDGRGRG